MEYRTLGRTGVQVSCLCFGTMSFGGDADEATSAAMFARCRDAGINFFDTANAYSGGRSEEILGRLIAGCRDDLVLTSKVHFPVGPDVNARGSSRRHILLSVEASLKRLGTDRLDLYFLHGFDAKTPIDRPCALSMTWCTTERSSIRQSATGRHGKSPRPLASPQQPTWRASSAFSPCTTS